MTPKEKAKELVNKMLDFTDWHNEDAKSCAIISVDEIIEDLSLVWIEFISKNNDNILFISVIEKEIEYLKDIKQEIIKL